MTGRTDIIILVHGLDGNTPQKSHPTDTVGIPEERLQSLSQKILLCANKIRPSVDFLIELSEILVTYSGCDALELWLREKDTCSRWEATARPNRFYRLGNMSLDKMQDRIKEGVVCFSGSAGDQMPDCSGDWSSVASVPLFAGEEKMGLMLLKSSKQACFDEDTIKSYNYISQVVAISVAYHRVQLEQRERVKELACLFDIARTVAGPRSSVDELLSRIVKHLPPAWQYPEITGARILLDEKEYFSGNYGNPKHTQSADITVKGTQRGEVRVSYVEDRPELDEGPFLQEERRLIDTIAREVAVIIEQKRIEEDRAKLQEQLLHADRLATIGQLAAGVAHELDEPLGGILGFAQLASKSPEVPEQVLKDLSKIEAASLHAREVVRKLMLFARQTLPTRKGVNLNELVEEGLYFLDSRCAKAGIELKRDLSKDLPEINVDPAQIHQVLINLVVNAIQSMEAGGTLEVKTFSREGLVCLSVLDSGCGMTEEVLKKIFVPFFTTKDVGEGTGLGLPVVHGIVTSHGGVIEVDSRPGEGTCFTIRLPLAPQDENTEGL